MLRNIDALQGLVFAESASIALAGVIGRPRAHGLLEQLTRKAVADGAQLVDVLVDAVQADAQLGKEIDMAMLRGCSIRCRRRDLRAALLKGSLNTCARCWRAECDFSTSLHITRQRETPHELRSAGP
jgi:hypothetical protein